MTTEAAFLEALGIYDTSVLEHGSLRLLDASGKSLVRLVAQPLADGE